MDSSDDQKLYCEECEFELTQTSIFCPGCGAIFTEDIYCVVHPSANAVGYCVICQKPFCENCGASVQNLFLCWDHESYEIIQGMVRVYGTADFANAEFIKDCLIKDGLEPFLYSRKATPYSMGGPDYTLFRSSGDYNGFAINEFKIMVPFNEVLKAEKIIESLNIDNEL